MNFFASNQNSERRGRTLANREEMTFFGGMVQSLGGYCPPPAPHKLRPWTVPDLGMIDLWCHTEALPIRNLYQKSPLMFVRLLGGEIETDVLLASTNQLHWGLHQDKVLLCPLANIWVILHLYQVSSIWYWKSKNKSIWWCPLSQYPLEKMNSRFWLTIPIPVTNFCINTWF